MKRPAFFLACTVLAGAVAGRVVVVPAAAGLGAFLLLLTAGVSLFLRRSAPAAAEQENRRRRAVLTRVLLGALFCLAFFQQNETVRHERLAEKQALLLQSEGPYTLRATVASEPSRQGRGGRLVAILRDVVILESSGDGLPAPGETNAAKEIPAPIRRFAGRVQLSLLRRAGEGFGKELPVAGERLEISGTLRPLPEVVHSDLFDYGAYLRTQGVGARLSVSDPEDVRRVEDEGSKAQASLYRLLMRWRRLTLTRLDRALPPERSGLMRALLLGETGGLEARTRETFVRAGVAHLLAVSGLHTGMLALIVFGVCRILQAPPRLAAWVTILLLAVYCVLVGFRAPVVRASIMAVCLAVPVLARRAVDTLTVLSIAAFFTALVNPLAPFRSDFQFSYACAFGLVTLRPALLELFSFSFRDRPYSIRRFLYLHNQWIAGGLAAVVAAQLAVIPLLSIYFHQVSLIGFVANLLMVPFAGVLLACGWAFSLLAALAPA
ncbi:MAG TPA: ComEC/Rec2 family competence protein, partial [Sumerlaeia bacterium]|nr:ComEC/Rec2 family competence protein [Sumerlaeia bacterium]